MFDIHAFVCPMVSAELLDTAWFASSPDGVIKGTAGVAASEKKMSSFFLQSSEPPLKEVPSKEATNVVESFIPAN